MGHTVRSARFELVASQWGAIPTREVKIDGRAVKAFVEHYARRVVPASGLISPVGWIPSANDEVTHARLFANGPPDFPCGRRAILVCRECGSFSCGALTVRITDAHDAIVWGDWLWQNDYDDEQSTDFGGLVPEIHFDRAQYLEVIRAACT